MSIPVYRNYKIGTQNLNNFAVLFMTNYFPFSKTISKDEKIENKHTTAFFKKVTLFNGHKSYQDEVKTLFHSVMPSKAQFRVCCGILQKLRSIIVQKASEPIYTTARETAQIKQKISEVLSK